MTAPQSIREIIEPLAPLSDRARREFEEHAAKEGREYAERIERQRVQFSAEARLEIKRVAGVPDDAVEMGEVEVQMADDTGPTAVSATVDGIAFRYVRRRYAGYSPHNTVNLVRTCGRCGAEELTPVSFLWQLGQALALGPHSDGCPTAPAEVGNEPGQLVDPGPRQITYAEERLINGLLDVLRERVPQFQTSEA